MSIDLLELAVRYHEWMPLRIRGYLHERGIANFVIDRYLLGWSGWRITIPIYDRSGVVQFFKLAKDPADPGDSPALLLAPDGAAELYGWEHLEMAAEQVIICDGELTRLLLESRGYAAVTSTGGADVFRRDWAKEFARIPRVYVCFGNDDGARLAAMRIGRLIPHARIVTLPAQVGEGGGVPEFFLRLNRSCDAFDELLAAGEPARRQRRPSTRGRRRLSYGHD